MKPTFLKQLILEMNGIPELRLKLLVLLFRLGTVLEKKKRILCFLYIPFNIIYVIYSKIFLSLEIPLGTKIGWGLRIYHGHSLVINKQSNIGSSFTVRHSVTIGNILRADGSESLCPIIGNNVEIGCNSTIIGPVHIGDNCKIGAGVTVHKNIAADTTVVPLGYRTISK
jgi:putative colanic acid biosynthesis acetyltransferase WcaB